MKLKQLVFPSVEMDWEPLNSFSKRYALVGRSSKAIHVVFDACGVTEAKEICAAYSRIRSDAGYDLLEVEKE